MDSEILFVDFETFFDSKGGYDLRKLSLIEYVRDSRFKSFGFGLAWGLDSDVGWQQDIIGFSDLSRVWICGHNIKFDGFILAEKYGVRPAGWIDTKAMSKAILGKSIKNHSLAALAQHFGLPEKGHLDTDGKKDLSKEERDALITYCKHDVWLCREIYKKLADDFPKAQYKIVSKTIDMFVYPKLELNTQLLESTAQKEKERKAAVFEGIGIPESKFASNPKFAELLRTEGFEVPTKKSPSNGKDIPALSLGDPAFIELSKSQNERLRALCRARIEAKSRLLETRATKLAAISKTGKWPFDVGFSGAEQTHRFSGGDGAGGNPQNFTRDSALREAVQAPKGYKLIVGDFSQIEFRLVAYLSGDKNLINLIETDADAYSDFATLFYRRPITKENEEERFFGKTAILGLGYGMGSTKFQKAVFLKTGRKIPDADARRTIDLYRGTYIGVPALWKQLDRLLPTIASDNISFTQGFVFGRSGIVLPSGLKIKYPGLRKSGQEYVFDAYNKGQLTEQRLYGGKILENLCQALAGEICKSAFMRCGGVVTGLVHDEIHLCVPENEAEDWALELYASMTESPAWLPNLKLDAEVHIGNNWREAK